MKHRTILVAVCGSIALSFWGSANAAIWTCPEMGQAVQVGACPSEDELRYTFTGYCSDDNKAYRGETDVCTSYPAYRAMKNVALWESRDGAFAGYLSCSASPRERQKALAQSMELGRQGKMTKLVCSYSNGETLTLRTRAQCMVESKACGLTGTECKASCD